MDTEGVEGCGGLWGVNTFSNSIHVPAHLSVSALLHLKVGEPNGYGGLEVGGRGWGRRERGEEAGEEGRRGKVGAREREASHGGISARGSARSALAPKGFKRGEDNFPLLSSGERHRRPRMHKCKMRNARSPCPPKAK